jgi:2-dehydro-3-deoxygluconokinase
VLCIGEAMVELARLDLVRGTARVAVAGDVFNTAVCLTREMPVSEVVFATALENDPLSEAMLGRIAEEGLSVGLVARLPGWSPGLYAVSVDEGGERSFTYWRAQSAARAMLAPGGIDSAALEGFDALFLSRITLAIQLSQYRAALVAMAGRTRAAGRLVVFDSNFRARLWANEEEAREAIAAMWAVTGLALPSRDDEAALWGLRRPRRCSGGWARPRGS